jgi:hypothetical protein
MMFVIFGSLRVVQTGHELLALRPKLREPNAWT